MSLGLVRLHFVEDPYLMILIIATISLGVVMPVLKERNLIETKLGQTILLIALVFVIYQFARRLPGGEEFSLF